MPILKNAKHEAFARAVAEGLSGTAAYRTHIATGAIKTESAMEAASRLLADIKVSSRVKELRTSFRDVLEQKLGVRQETLARYLVSIAETPVGEVDPNSALCQEYKRTRRMVGRGEEAEEWETEQVKTPSKLDAVDKLNKMAGWYEPEKIEHSGTVAIPGLEAAAKAVFAPKA